MRYFKEYDKNGYISAIGAGDALNGIDITQEEYETLLVEIEAKMEYTEQVYRHEISIADVPTEWREEVQYLVDGKIATEGAFDPDEISDADRAAEEALAILAGEV